MKTPKRTNTQRTEWDKNSQAVGVAGGREEGLTPDADQRENTTSSLDLDHGTAASRTLRQELGSLSKQQMSARTVRRLFQQHGLSARRRWLRIHLKLHHRQERLHMWDQRQTWAKEWQDAVFTDEYRFYLQHQDCRIHVWWHRVECTLAVCICHRPTGPSPGLMPNSTFQQNNVRPHVAGMVRTFFDTENVWLMLWSARTPDLSPIENVWSMFAERLTHHHTPVTAADELWHLLAAALEYVPVHVIHSLVDSMLKHIIFVITDRVGCFGY
ncbi:transposable element Tcb1 transposase [Trichonephila clavipes]|nr:transposable element Tcb1 transposase [Trichonephila clavipes]